MIENFQINLIRKLNFNCFRQRLLYEWTETGELDTVEQLPSTRKLLTHLFLSPHRKAFTIVLESIYINDHKKGRKKAHSLTDKKTHHSECWTVQIKLSIIWLALVQRIMKKFEQCQRHDNDYGWGNIIVDVVYYRNFLQQKQTTAVFACERNCTFWSHSWNNSKWCTSRVKVIVIVYLFYNFYFVVALLFFIVSDSDYHIYHFNIWSKAKRMISGRFNFLLIFFLCFNLLYVCKFCNLEKRQ